MTPQEPDGDQPARRPSFPTRQDLRRIVDRGPVGFVITNKAGVIEWVNATLLQWLGYEGSELIGHRTFQELLSPGGRIYYDTHVRPLVHMQRGANEIALELVCADQRRLSVLINASSETDEHTGEQTIETFVVDATRRREYEVELLRERQLAERSAARLQVMYDIVSGLAMAETVEHIVGVVTEHAARSMDGAKCAIWIFEPGDRAAGRVGQIPDAEKAHPLTVAFPEGGPALDQLRSGQVVVIADRLASAATYPLVCRWMAESGLRSAAIAPLSANRRLYGAVSYGFQDVRILDDLEVRTALALAAQTHQGLRRARSLEVERRNKQRLQSLLDFATVLSAALTLDEVIDAIVEGGQQLLGAVGTRVALLDDTDEAVWFGRRSSSGGDLGIRLPLDRRSIGCEAIRTNRAVVVESRRELVELFPESPILDHPNFGRVMSMPLRRGDEVLGAWVLADSHSGAEAIDVTIFELFADQAGQATQRATIHEAETLARNQADTRNLVSAALNRAVTTSDVGRAITVQGRAAFGAAALAFFVVHPNDPTVLQLETQSGVNDDLAAVESTVFVDADLASLLSGPPSPRFSNVVSEFDDLLDVALGANRHGPAAVLPLIVAGNPLGLIVVGFERPDALSSAMRVALSGLSGEATVALVRARRYDVDHDVAATLQRSLMPSIESPGPEWELTSSHRPWSEVLEVGGDLFDVTPFDDGRLMLVVGDVVGHGLEAAAAMGLLRSAAKMLTLVSASPAEVIAGLHAFARVTPGVLCSSMCCVEVQSDRYGRYSCAGHPFPVLRHRGGRTEVLDGGRSPLLGVGDAVPTNAGFVIDVGSTLVVYTDGLIERRETSLDFGVDRLRQYLGRVGDAPGEVCADDIVAAMLDDEQNEDDVVAVCLTRVASRRPG